MENIDEITAGFIVLGFLAVTAYWSIRGILQLFQRHNSILVIVYLLFLFPVAYFHALLLGIFGKSKAKRLEAEILAEAEKQIKIDNIKASKKS